MRYTASTEDMQEYSRIIQTIARLDMETERLQAMRTEAIGQLRAWEESHAIKEDETEAPQNASVEDPDLEKVGLPA